MGQDVSRAAWAGGARLGFEASQVTGCFGQWVRDLQVAGHCSGLWKPQPSSEKSYNGGGGVKEKKTSCEEIEEENRLINSE